MSVKTISGVSSRYINTLSTSHQSSIQSKRPPVALHTKIYRFFRKPAEKESVYCWILVLISMLLQAMLLGFTNIFGLFYVQLVQEFGPRHTEIAWIGSSTKCTVFLLAPLADKIVRRLGLRLTIASGSMFCVGSIMTTSFVNVLDAFFASFSLMYGAGASMIFISTNMLVVTYFDRSLPMAAGIISSGSSFGTLILSVIANQMIKVYTWRKTWQVFTYFMAITVILALFFKPVQEDCSTETKDTNAYSTGVKLRKNRVFIIWVIVCCLVMYGAFVPFIHLVSYATKMGVNVVSASWLITAIAASSGVGRIVVGKIVRLGIIDSLHIHQLAMVITGTFTMVLPSLKTLPLLMVYAIAVGATSSCHMVLLPVLTSDFVGAKNMTRAFGLLNCVSSFFFMAGPTIAGLLYEKTGTYSLAFQISATPILISSALLFLIPWAQKTTFTSETPVDQTAPSVPYESATGTLQHKKMQDMFDRRVKNLILEIAVPTPPEHSPTSGTEGFSRGLGLEYIREKSRSRFASLQEVSLSNGRQLPIDAKYNKPTASFMSVDIDNFVSTVRRQALYNEVVDPATGTVSVQIVDRLHPSLEIGKSTGNIKAILYFAEHSILMTQLLKTQNIASELCLTSLHHPTIAHIDPSVLMVSMNKTSSRKGKSSRTFSVLDVIYETEKEAERSDELLTAIPDPIQAKVDQTWIYFDKKYSEPQAKIIKEQYEVIDNTDIVNEPQLVEDLFLQADTLSVLSQQTCEDDIDDEIGNNSDETLRSNECYLL